MSETHTPIKGRSQRTALLLLTAAAQLEHPKQVVRTQQGGYLVPNDVAERYEELLAELESDEDAEVEDPKPPAKRTAAKRTAKKTAAKTTQAQE